MPVLAAKIVCSTLDTPLLKPQAPPFKHAEMPRDKRQKRDLHALSEEGMVLCNPRDKEAAHRAMTEGIATDNWTAVTCGKCLSLLYKHNKTLKVRRGHG